MNDRVELIVEEVRVSEDDEHVVLLKERNGDRAFAFPMLKKHSKTLVWIINNPESIPQNIIGLIGELVKQGNMNISHVMIESADDGVLAEVYSHKKGSLLKKSGKSVCAVYESLCIASHLSIPVFISSDNLDKYKLAD